MNGLGPASVSQPADGPASASAAIEIIQRGEGEYHGSPVSTPHDAAGRGEVGNPSPSPALATPPPPPDAARRHLLSPPLPPSIHDAAATSSALPSRLRPTTPTPLPPRPSRLPESPSTSPAVVNTELVSRRPRLPHLTPQVRNGNEKRE